MILNTRMPKKKNIGKNDEVYNIILYHIIIYKAKLTKKPSKAPAMTSIVLSIHSSTLAAEPEDNTA